MLAMNGTVATQRSALRAASEDRSDQVVFYPALICGVASLLGGPFAAPVLATLNARSLNGLRRERVWLISGAIVAFAASVLVAWSSAHTMPREMGAMRSVLYIAGPAIDLLLWAVLFWHQRAWSRGPGAKSVNAPRLWTTCLIVVVSAQLAQIAVTLVARRFLA